MRVVNIKRDLEESIEGKCNCVEDIIDSGNIKQTCPIFRSRNPKSLTICTLLDKQDKSHSKRCKWTIQGLRLDEFVVGFGLTIIKISQPSIY